MQSIQKLLTAFYKALNGIVTVHIYFAIRRIFWAADSQETDTSGRSVLYLVTEYWTQLISCPVPDGLHPVTTRGDN